MIVVTGAARSATSYMVLTIKNLLGVEAVGEEWFPEHGPKSFNPDGYWSLPVADLINGVNTTEYQGKVIKILGFFLEKTNPRYVTSVVYCKRDPSFAIPSLTKLCIEMGEFPVNECKEIANKSYKRHIQGVESFLYNWRGPLLTVDIADRYTDEADCNIKNQLKEFFECHTQVQ